MKRRIAVFTGTRAEYGLLQGLMKAIQDDATLELQVIVSGAHLAPQFGQTWRDHEPDTAPIDLSQTIEEIQSHNADLVLLQEVERATPGWTQPLLPPNYLRMKQALPGYDSYIEFPKTDERELPFGIGIAIFSKTPLRQHALTDLPSPAVEFTFKGKRLTPTDRVFIGASTTIDEREIRVMTTHLLALFMLNAIEALGVPVPVFRPVRNPYEQRFGLAPAIVPAIKARDFSFTSTIDAI